MNAARARPIVWVVAVAGIFFALAIFAVTSRPRGVSHADASAEGERTAEAGELVRPDESHSTDLARALVDGRATDNTGDEPTPRRRASDEPARDSAANRELHPAPAPADAGTSTLEAPIVGSIQGFLVREGGPWTAATLPKPRTVMLDLVSTRDRRASWRGEIAAELDGAGGYRLTFTFDDLPAGEYELTLSALGSFRWAPISLRVRPPLAGVTFTRYDLDKKVPLAFEVFDAESGARIDAFQTRHLQLTPSAENGVFLHTGPLELDAFPLQSRFAWSLWAEGYAPVYGDESAFVERGEQRVAAVRLARGWSTKVLVLARDPQARQVRGAEVLVDGRSSGYTDSEGMLVVRAAARPARLEVRFGAWKPVSDPLGPYNGLRAEQRGQVTIVMLEK